MSEVQIRFRAVFCHEYFAMLNRIHGTWVDIDIRVEFLHGYFVTARF